MLGMEIITDALGDDYETAMESARVTSNGHTVMEPNATWADGYMFEDGAWWPYCDRVFDLTITPED